MLPTSLCLSRLGPGQRRVYCVPGRVRRPSKDASWLCKALQGVLHVSGLVLSDLSGLRLGMAHLLRSITPALLILLLGILKAEHLGLWSTGT